MNVAAEFLSQYVKLAEHQAAKSQCSRRQYGVAIVNKNADAVFGFNERVTRCCTDRLCARDRFKIGHGRNTEVGGEVHAEQAALIRWGFQTSTRDWYFLIVGLSKGKKLYGVQLYPCYACARMIKYAGFKYVYLEREGDGEIIPISIEEILEYREQEWLNVDDAGITYSEF